ncbi:MAG TPA: hypothetical protein VHL53_13405 [Acidimicrobiia bacterium]|nr:hypothetical protein [Acidimicrobiia bacterium]
MLHSVQESFGYLDLDGLAYVGEALGVPPSRVYFGRVPPMDVVTVAGDRRDGTIGRSGRVDQP